MSYEYLLCENRDDTAIIRLNRPERANALSRPVMLELHAALDAARDHTGVRAVMLIGTGKTFSAGADLKGGSGRAITELDLGESIENFMNPLIRRIRELPKPVVAAVNGTAAGGGCNLALACDIVVAARSARFMENFSRVGLVLDGGGSYVLPRLIGPARARAVALLAESITADTALQWGMIWSVVEDDRLFDEALALTRRLADVPGKGCGAMKALLNASEANDFERQIALERDMQRSAGRSEAFRQAVTAFGRSGSESTPPSRASPEGSR